VLYLLHHDFVFVPVIMRKFGTEHAFNVLGPRNWAFDIDPNARNDKPTYRFPSWQSMTLPGGREHVSSRFYTLEGMGLLISPRKKMRKPTHGYI